MMDLNLYSGLEQSMVAMERVNEFSVLPREPPEYIEPRVPPEWPHEGKIEVDNLVIRYAVRWRIVRQSKPRLS